MLCFHFLVIIFVFLSSPKAANRIPSVHIESSAKRCMLKCDSKRIELALVRSPPFSAYGINVSASHPFVELQTTKCKSLQIFEKCMLDCMPKDQLVKRMSTDIQILCKATTTDSQKKCQGENVNAIMRDCAFKHAPDMFDYECSELQSVHQCVKDKLQFENITDCESAINLFKSALSLKMNIHLRIIKTGEIGKECQVLFGQNETEVWAFIILTLGAIGCIIVIVIKVVNAIRKRDMAYL